jgi:hypothetical protein
MWLRRLAWVIPLALFFLNPALACGGGDEKPTFQFGAAELRAAIEGTWSLTLTPSGGAAKSLVVRIEQATQAPSDATPPCGGRTLVKPAAACVPITTMPLQVTMLSGDAAFEGVALSGNFAVTGFEFSEGQVTLAVGETRVAFRLTPESGPSNVQVTMGPSGTATVTRQPAG